MIILDSDVLIEILDKRSKRGEEAADRLRETGEEIATTSLNLHEVLYGFEKASKKTRALDAIPVLGYDRGDAQLSANLELATQQRGRTTPRMDAMIAAIAINNNATLYTFNREHFEVLAEDGLKLL